MEQVTSVSSRLLTTKLVIGKWTGEAAVPKIARDAEKSNSAKSGTVKATARAFESPELTAVLQEMNSLYIWWRDVTSPWRDGGWRVLLGETAMEFLDEARERIGRIERDLVPAFLASYPQRLEEMKLGMGALYLQVRYPTPEDMRNRFTIRMSMEAVPDADMLKRFGEVFSANEIEAAREAERMQVQAAMEDVWTKLATPVEHLIDVLTRADMGQHKRWHDSIVTNIADAARTAAKLNFTGSKELVEVADAMLADLAVAKTGTLRDAPEVRADVKAKAEAIKARMAGFLPKPVEG